NNSYIKAGFGSQRTPFVQAGISFGDGKTAGLNIYAKHVASQGNREFQDFSHTNIALGGFFETPKKLQSTSFGDGKTAGLNIYAKHVASQGKREFQDFSHTNIALGGFFQTTKNLEWNAKLGMQSDQTYKYGFLPESLSFKTDSLKQRFQTFYGRVAFHNVQPN